VSLDEFADTLLVSLPEPRVQFYESANYEEVMRRVMVYINRLVDDLGYYPVEARVEVLNSLEQYSYAVLFMGLIFDIILLLFVIISILLVYSLLMISVETKTFEIGVMRMVGLSQGGIVAMVLLQGLMFVLPAIVAAFLLCVPTLFSLYSALLTKDLGVANDPVPALGSVLQALALGLVIPAAASVQPIRVSLSKSLGDALDYQRAKSQANFEAALSKPNSRTQILVGSLTVVYGLSIYYLLPVAMLELDLQLILRIFLLILMGMLLGLTLLSFNLVRLLEIAIVHVFLVFEPRSTKKLILKNLEAHKMRNKMTSLIFALALGFIIFLVVSYNLQLQSAQMLTLQREGS